MKMKSLQYAVVLSFLLISSVASAEGADATYYALVDKAVASKGVGADWRALREAYQDTSFYEGSAGDVMVKMKMGKLADAAKTPEDKKAYIDFARKHFALFRTHFYDAAMAKSGKGGFADFETNMTAVKSIIDSVRNSGDGKSCETSMFVVDVSEEYMVLQIVGVKPAGQSVVRAAEKTCDKLNFIDPKTKQASSLYFDVTKMLATPLR